MNYSMKELIPIVAKLSEKYTGLESSSITYEKAEQLMGAVIYCIKEFEACGHNYEMAKEKVPALQAYTEGKKCVINKVKLCLEIYNSILPEFNFYKNNCLYDTVVKGLPEFFKWYDVEFCPQNTILTLDYPILQDISKYSGVNKIYYFINAIRLEQIFLQKFPDEYIVKIMDKYSDDSEDMIENICEIVLCNTLSNMLAKKNTSEYNFGKEDYSYIRNIITEMNYMDLAKLLEGLTESFIKQYYNNDMELFEYLNLCIKDISVRMKNLYYFGN